MADSHLRRDEAPAHLVFGEIGPRPAGIFPPSEYVMRSSNMRLLVLAALGGLLVSFAADAAPAPDDPKAAAKERESKQWKEMFGKDIDFAEVGLHLCMLYVYPQPEKAFKELDDKKYSPALLDFSDYWTGEFFRPACRPNVRKAPPEKYYLPDRPKETGLVLHEWRSPKFAFRAQESGNGVLVRIVPKGYDPKTPLSGKELAALLFDVFHARLSRPTEEASSRSRKSATFITATRGRPELGRPCLPPAPAVFHREAAPLAANTPNFASVYSWLVILGPPALTDIPVVNRVAPVQTATR
jgi:hypothetical protein